MSKDECKFDITQPNSTISKSTNKNVSNEVKILNRGDLLGAINCLFPELQLKSGHIKLKQNFSLFSYSLQELTKIFESGRKYRTRIAKKCSIANHSMHSLRTDSSRINVKRNANTLGNLSTKSTAFTSRKSKAQTKHHNQHSEPSKRYETVQFQSSYTDFVTKCLESHFPDRFVDFKNIERLIQELHNLYKEISKEDKIGPFNPNLPVLNISECDQVARINSGSKDIVKLKPSTSVGHILNKKKSRSHLAIKTLKIQKEVKEKENRSKVQHNKTRGDSQHVETPTMNRNNCRLADADFNDDDGKEIERNIEDLLNEDTFTPRYKAMHSADMFMIFRNAFNRNDCTTSEALEREAVEQYENVDDSVDVSFNLLEIQARQQYEM